MNNHSLCKSIEGETEQEYVIRIRRKLPNWPEEVVIEWLFRHQGFLEPYSSLDWKRFRFTLLNLTTIEIPGCEVFMDETICNSGYKDFLNYAKEGEWLATYMLNNGTWNTPIILLSNPNADLTDRWKDSLKSPLHLLEGHRRLSYFTMLRQLHKAKDSHYVWLVSLD